MVRGEGLLSKDMIFSVDAIPCSLFALTPKLCDLPLCHLFEFTNIDQPQHSLILVRPYLDCTIAYLILTTSSSNFACPLNNPGFHDVLHKSFSSCADTDWHLVPLSSGCV